MTTDDHALELQKAFLNRKGLSFSDILHCLVQFGTTEQWRRIFSKRRSKQSWRTLYHAYIVSAAWKRKKHEAFERAGWYCTCGRTAVQVHHLTYERLGDELPEDLESICVDCHKKKHNR